MIFQNKRKKIKTPEGYEIFINPIYHGPFFAQNAIENYEIDIRKTLNTLVKPGMVIYDIGANVGVFSLLFAFKTGQNGLSFFEYQKF